MRSYETVFILNPELGADAQTEQIEFFKNNIQTNGGEILSVESWGKLALAYKIERFTEGVYVLIQFNADVNYIAELEKRFRYNEEIIRFVVVMLDEKKFKQKPRKDAVKRERKSKQADTQDIEFTDSEDTDFEAEVAVEDNE